MNEKIEELFEKAANKKFPTCETIIHPSELQEFAEMIILKCAEISEDNFHHGLAGAREMRTYFGVK